jgi:hypothetical protein
LIFKKYVGGGGGMDWIYLAENWVKQQAVVNMVMKKINKLNYNEPLDSITYDSYLE